MNPEWLRYYIAAKLNANVEDLDFNPDDFLARVNSDLVGKYVNIASRAASFITKQFGGKVRRSMRTAWTPARSGRCARWMRQNASAKAYESREFGKVIREVMRSRRSHQSGHSTRRSRGSWRRIRPSGSALHEVCSDAIDAFRRADASFWRRSCPATRRTGREAVRTRTPTCVGPTREATCPTEISAVQAPDHSASRRSSSTSCSTFNPCRSRPRRSGTRRSSSRQPRSRP